MIIVDLLGKFFIQVRNILTKYLSLGGNEFTPIPILKSSFIDSGKFNPDNHCHTLNFKK